MLENPETTRMALEQHPMENGDVIWRFRDLDGKEVAIQSENGQRGIQVTRTHAVFRVYKDERGWHAKPAEQNFDSGEFFDLANAPLFDIEIDENQDPGEAILTFLTGVVNHAMLQQERPELELVENEP